MDQDGDESRAEDCDDSDRDVGYTVQRVLDPTGLDSDGIGGQVLESQDGVAIHILAGDRAMAPLSSMYHARTSSDEKSYT